MDWLDVFLHDKFTEEVQNRIQAMAKLPPPPLQGRKLNCRISQQGALYNGVAVALGDMLLEGGGGGGKGFFVISYRYSQPYGFSQ